MTDQGEGAIKEMESRRYTLPADNPTGKRVWASGGTDCKAMPCRIKPLTHNMEMKASLKSCAANWGWTWIQPPHSTEAWEAKQDPKKV
jgi:hypothetical protein